MSNIVNVSGAGGVGGGGYATIQNNGTALAQRTTLDVIGRGFVANDDAGGGRTRLYIFDLRTQLYEFDDFISGGASNDQWGKLGWYNLGGTVSYLSGVTGHPGIIRLSTGTSAGTTCGFGTPENSQSKIISPADFFDVTFWLRANSTDNLIYSCGLGDDETSWAPSNAVQFFYNKNGTGAVAIQGRCSASGTATSTNMGFTADTGWHRFRVYRQDASTIAFTVDDANLLTITTNIPTAALTPFVALYNYTTTGETLDLDAFDILITGLSR